MNRRSIDSYYFTIFVNKILLSLERKSRSPCTYLCEAFLKETLIKSLSDFALKFLCIARNNLTRIASYLRKAMTKLCIKILVEADSAI